MHTKQSKIRECDKKNVWILFAAMEHRSGGALLQIGVLGHFIDVDTRMNSSHYFDLIFIRVFFSFIAKKCVLSK